MTKILSYGGGLDSFAMLVDAISRNELPDVVCMADVGDPQHAEPGEWPSTYRHVEEVVKPLCAKHGIPFVLLDGDRYPVRGAKSLFRWLSGDRAPGAERGNVSIPVAGPNRICTRIAKTERFESWMNENYANETVEVWIGFEAGEEGRAEKDPNAGTGKAWRPGEARRVNRFPLMERGLCRCRCEQLVRDAGFPVPRKSACTFCPYASKGDWQTLARELPETFEAIVALEAAKPLTKKNGLKLSIMGYSSAMKNKLGRAYVPPALPRFIQGKYTRKVVPCHICGAAQRATKATGCDYLPEPELLAEAA